MFSLSVFLATQTMEMYSRFAHRFLWHGPLWFLHKSHHTKRCGVFEANDLLGCLNALFFVPMTLTLFLTYLHDPCMRHLARFGACVGADMYGISYILIHDGVNHGRFFVPFLRDLPHVKKMVAAHSVHHVTGREPYGLWHATRELSRDSTHWKVSIFYAIMLCYMTGMCDW